MNINSDMPVWYVKLLIVSLFVGIVVGAYRNYKGVYFNDPVMYVIAMFIGAGCGPLTVMVVTLLVGSLRYLFT